MTSTRDISDSGLFTGDVNFVRESTTGQFEMDPSFTLFSDEVVDVSWSPGFGVSRRDAVGTPDAAGHDKEMEEGEIEITYRLQRQLVDGSGVVDDPAGDAFDRTADNLVPNTHQVRIRDSRSTADTDDPDSASGAWQFIQGLGCKPDATIEDTADSSAPMEVTLTYACEKVRMWNVYQPDSSGLTVASSDSADTTQTLTLEDGDGNTEDVSLNGTTSVDTTKTDWSSLKAFELDSETVGDVTIETTSASDTLVTIRGSDYYAANTTNTLEGDKGLQVLGSGSLGSAVGNDFETIQGAEIKRGGSSFSYDVPQLTMDAGNNLDSTSRHTSYRPRMTEGNRDTTVAVDLVGWGSAADLLDQMAGVTTDNVTFNGVHTDFEFKNAVVADADGVERGPDDATIAFNVTFEPSNDGGLALTQA